MPDWRAVNPEDWTRLRENFVETLKQREAFGREKYGGDFVGSPVQHAKEEIYDLVFYIYKIESMIKSWREELVEIIDLPGYDRELLLSMLEALLKEVDECIE